MSIDVTRARTNSLAEQVAEEIRVLLARRRIKQSHLARELGVNDQWVSVRLRGVTPLDLLDLERIAAVLEVPVTELLPRSAAEAPARSVAGGGSRITVGSSNQTERMIDGMAGRPGHGPARTITGRPQSRPSSGVPSLATRRPGLIRSHHGRMAA
jgi:DNA-binding Xre family transcriptional regulator